MLRNMRIDNKEEQRRNVCEICLLTFYRLRIVSKGSYAHFPGANAIAYFVRDKVEWGIECMSAGIMTLLQVNCAPTIL